MHKLVAPFYLFVLSLLLTTAVFADIGSEQVELSSAKIRTEKTHLYAEGNIVLKYTDIVFLADRAVYDRMRQLLTVSGNVQIIKQDGSRIRANKVTLKVAQEHMVFKQFLYTHPSSTWVSSREAQKHKECYKLNNAFFSSCAISNPDWRFGFSEATFDPKKKYMTLKDIKFYVGDTPVFYFPYLGFSTARERSSGLLIPKVGYSSKEGLYYEQPIYWAISPSMDLEVSPQIRTGRGAGLYATFRFVDSNSSSGFIRAGYFTNWDEYRLEENLKNSAHYGFEAYYESSDVLGNSKPAGYHDGLYINLIDFNDIDYINLQKNTLAYLSDSHLKESRINYLLYNDDHYFGLNAHYYLDASKEENSDTLQELPTLHWHKFTEPFGISNLHYSIDMKLHNYTRSQGARAKQMEITLPVEYYATLMDDYLKVKVSEEVYAQASFFDSVMPDNDRFNAVWATHSIMLFSDLVRPYEAGVHTMQWSLEYAKQTHGGKDYQEYIDFNDTLKKDFLFQKPFDEKVTLALNHYWYTYGDTLSAKQRIAATYYPAQGHKWGELQHELALVLDDWSLANAFDYSYMYNALSKLSNTIAYRSDTYTFDIGHYWRKDLEKDEITSNEVTLKTDYQYSETLKLFASATYGLEENNEKEWGLGFLYDRKCWSVRASITREIKPILEEDGGGSQENTAFYVQFNLSAFGGSDETQE